jgi:hypothetical protein
MRNMLFGIALVLALVPSSVTAQRPDGWKVRFDRAGADSTKLEFVSMPPGWHITTGPSVALWNPATTAKGNFTVESKTFLFKPSGTHAEGFGLILGGSNLDGEAQRYTYFLIRNDGMYLVKERNGKETKDIIPWTASPAIRKFDGKAESVENVLSVTAGATSVDFSINGTKVASKPRSGMALDGIVGLRVNHNLNLHVATLAVK